MEEKTRGEGRTPSVHQGHRQRAKEEFIKRGLENLPDHKVLELLLFYAIPQGDVNPLAHTLLNHFGTLTGVFHATYEQLLEVKGVGANTAALIKLLPAVAARYMADRVEIEGQIISNWQYQELLLPLFFGARNEMVYLVCLDAKNKLIACRKLGEGIVDQVAVASRKALEAALSCNASRVVLAHNHVSGVACFSQADIMTTWELKELLAKVDIELVDHFVVSDGEMVSMVDSGVLNRD